MEILNEKNLFIMDNICIKFEVDHLNMQKLLSEQDSIYRSTDRWMDWQSETNVPPAPQLNWVMGYIE